MKIILLILMLFTTNAYAEEYYAVKFYSDVENPKGIPGEWPAEVKELGESDEAPRLDGYTVMSVGEYQKHRLNHIEEYQSWENQIVASEKAEEAAVKESYDEAKADIVAASEKETLTAEESEAALKDVLTLLKTRIDEGRL